MSDIKRILEKMDTMSKAEDKPTGPKFPGYWKGKDSAEKSKSKMVGGCEESIIKELHNTAKEKVTEWQLEEKFKEFKESHEHDDKDEDDDSYSYKKLFKKPEEEKDQKPKEKVFRNWKEYEYDKDHGKEVAEEEKIAGRYSPEKFDAMVQRVGQKAKEQERRRGPVDIAALAKRLRALDKKEPTKEQEDPAVNKQDPDSQVTSQTSPQQDPAAVKQQQIDQMQDVSTAKSTMSGLSTVLGSGVNPNALSSAVNKISDGKPLTAPEATSMSALTPLIAKAAESPQSAPSLKTALSNAAMLARQGK